MKKIIALLTALLLLMTCSSCSDRETDSPAGPETESANAVPATEKSKTETMETGLFEPKPAFAVVTAEYTGEYYTGECLIVRDETAFTAENMSSVEYTAEEDARVREKDLICQVYSSGYSEKERKELQEYRDDIRAYQLELLSKEETEDETLIKTESDVLTQARETREMIHGARGSISRQRKQLKAAFEARKQYLRQKFSGNDRMSRLYSEENQQMQKIQSWVRNCYANEAGIVSFYSDGFEDILNVSSFEQFTPAEVWNMLNGSMPGTGAFQRGKTTVYRIVRENGWCVLMLINDNSRNPAEGEIYELYLENAASTVVSAKVVSCIRSGRELLVRLRVEDEPVQPVLYMRKCTGVLGNGEKNLIVPEKAIYRQNDQTGVVRMEDGNKQYVPVTVVKWHGGYCFITPVQPGSLEEGQEIELFD